MDFILDSLWKSGQVKVKTFSLNELLGTKIRALHQRKKGRDLYDLWKAKKLKPDLKRVGEIFLQYMKQNGTLIHRDNLIGTLNAKLDDPAFINDMKGLVKNLDDYDIRSAADFVIKEIFCHVPESKSKQKKRKRLIS